MSKTKTAVFTLIMLALTALCIEAASYGYMRIVLRDYTGGAAYTGQPLNSKLAYKVGDEVVEYYINNLGFRDRSHEAAKPDGVRRIAIFGDSFTEGWGVNQLDIFTVRLQEMLDKACGAGSFEVFNFGLRHTGPGFAFRLYERMVRQFKPDATIFVTYAGNDFRDAAREAKEDVDIRNQVENNFGGGSRYFSFKPMGADYRPFQYLTGLIGYFKAALRQGVMKGGLTDAQLESENFKRLDPETRRKARENRIHILLLQMALDNPDILPSLFHEVEKGQRDAYEGFLAPWTRTVADDGGLFVLAAIPGSTQIGREQFGELARMGFRVGDELLGLRGPQNALADMAGKLGRERGDAFVYRDLTESFANAAKTEDLYLEYDDHINADGHALVAGSLFSILKERMPAARACFGNQGAEGLVFGGASRAIASSSR